MSTQFLRILTIITTLCIAPIGNAEIITFQFEGAVSSSNKLTSFPIGQQVLGQYSFDSTIADSNPGSSEQGVYDNVTYFTFTSGLTTGVASSKTAIGGSFVEVIIVNRNSVFDPERYEVFSPCYNTPDSKCEVEIGGEDLMRMRLLLQGDNGTEIQSIDLPLEPPNIENFNIREFGLIFEYDATNDPGVKFNITSLEKIDTPVPDPESDDDFLLLFLPAILSGNKDNN